MGLSGRWKPVNAICICTSCRLREYLIRCIGDERLRDAEYSFEFYDRLLPDLNGKRSYFKTNVPKEKDDANNIGSGD